MKMFFLVSIVCQFLPPLDLYKINFSTLEGQTISLGEFAGKRILVVSIDGPNASMTQFRYLDSLQNAIKDLQIIVVPVISDYWSTGDKEVRTAKLVLKSNVIVAAASLVNRNAEKDQHPLFKWLTSEKYNKHFDIDGKSGQYYLISSKGTLYAVLNQGATVDILEKVLMIKFDESQNIITNPESF